MLEIDLYLGNLSKTNTPDRPRKRPFVEDELSE